MLKGIREWRNLEIQTLFGVGREMRQRKGTRGWQPGVPRDLRHCRAQRRTPGIRDWRKPGLGRQDSYRRFGP